MHGIKIPQQDIALKRQGGLMREEGVFMVLVIDFELAHRLLNLSFIHLCTNLKAQQ